MNEHRRAGRGLRSLLALAFGIGAGLMVTAPASIAADRTTTQRQYLSGHGPKDAVPWEFFCTEGRQSGQWTTIPVPSHWEQHGFGGYDYGQGSAKRAEERGQYRRKFTLPEAWKGKRVRLVFEGVMTDTRVTVNGKSAGPTHVGGFYRFRYDITDLVKRDVENLLEVEVSKVSATRETEIAERHGDYWVFGGIYRPVYLEAVPAQSIDQVSLDARADGTLAADIELALVTTADHIEAQVLTSDGEPVGAAFSSSIAGGGAPRVRLATKIAAPKLWSAETPTLYRLRVTLYRGTEALHEVVTRFGFRTFEIRPGAGLFLNGNRIVLRGVNRHSFRPDTGRALNVEDCYEDVRLLQSMNMNAVRMSHYPPDVAFLEACDELGLYVLDELSGWQKAHDTETGRRLVREMVTRDVNHPSILFWDNGNEGGWNRTLDVEFARYDPQQRAVLHPWETFSGIDTVHYKSYADMEKRAQGPHLIMPTEFLHGMFDGGAGAGLDDYWRLLSKPPYGAGGFIWVLADEGIVRTDQGGRIDVWSTYGPDGIVGPRHEKEASYYTVRQVFSPVQIDAPTLDARFDGTLAVHNHYSFTSLDQCRFAWSTLRFAMPGSGSLAPQALDSGVLQGPAIRPATSGTLKLKLPRTAGEADALSVTVSDPNGRELWTWVWPTSSMAARLKAAHSSPPAPAARKAQRQGDAIVLQAGDVTAQFDARTGLLHQVANAGTVHALGNGPRFVLARPTSSAQKTTWTKLDADMTSVAARTWASKPIADTPASLVELKYEPGASWYGGKLEISDGKTWRTIFDGTRRSNDGDRYAFSPQPVTAVRLSNLHRTDGNPVTLRSVRLGYIPERYPTSGQSVSVTSGDDWVEAHGGDYRFRWTLRADGSLKLDYSYQSSGVHVYRGMTFDCPEDGVRRFQWLGLGPHRVWQNRIHGTWFGTHEHVRSAQTGPWDYPAFSGYFADVRSMRIETTAGAFEVTPNQPGTFVRVGTPLTDHPFTTADFPPGDFTVLEAISAMGSKFRLPADTGPASQPATGPESYENSVVFRFER